VSTFSGDVEVDVAAWRRERAWRWRSAAQADEAGLTWFINYG